MDDITDDFRLSFLAGTRNLMLDLHCALADIVPSLRLDPWSWPGMTVSESLVAFSGCLLVFRHKNIRTKGFI